MVAGSNIEEGEGSHFGSRKHLTFSSELPHHLALAPCTPLFDDAKSPPLVVDDFLSAKETTVGGGANASTRRPCGNCSNIGPVRLTPTGAMHLRYAL
jgi:hypothetical protein